nr:hypothetical protein [Tanacetum cinerariifolium]
MMQSAGLMSPEELIAWEKKEAGSPLLRTSLLKKRKGIKFLCKSLFGDFLHVDSVGDKLGLHDNWLYEGLSLDGPIEVGGPSIYVDETVVCNGHSLPNIYKKCFVNFVPLDSVGANLQVVLKKKGRSTVKLKGLGGLVALNDHDIDDDPQLKSQV